MCERRPTTCSASGATDGDGRFRIEALAHLVGIASSRSTPWPAAAARLRARLGRAQPRRRAARGRDPPPARAGHPRQAGRRQRPAGRRGRGPASEHLLARPTGIRFHRPPMGGSSRRDPGLAEARHHRRPGPVHIRRHRPRLRHASTSATPASPSQRFDLEADDRDDAKEVTLALQPATIIEGRVLAADTGQPIPDAVISVTGQLRHVRRDVHDQVPRRRPGTVPDQSLRRATTSALRVHPPRASPTWSGRTSSPGPRGRSRRRSNQAAPRRADPRQGDRGGDRPAGGRGQRPVLPEEAGARMSSWLRGDRGQQGRRLVPGRRPARQGIPARPGTDPRLHPRGDRRRGCSTERSARRHAPSTPTTSSPTRSRPAKRPTSSTPRSGRARRSGPRGRPRGADRSSDAVILTRLNIDPVNLTWRGASLRSTPATAASSCTASTRRRPRRSTSSTPITSGARRSSSRASRPARS